MNLPVDLQKAQHEIAKFLPQPLYVLYVQATAYRDACDSNLEVKIQGDVDAAKAQLETKNLQIGGHFSHIITLICWYTSDPYSYEATKAVAKKAQKIF